MGFASGPPRRMTRIMRPESGGESPFRLHCADARELADLFSTLGLPSKPFLTTTITSPPYGALKDYGGRNQVGWRQAHEDYLADCGKVFEQIHAATVEQGSLWLIADTITTRRAAGVFQLQMLPFQLAEVATDVGWTLRDVIIWHKDRTVPWAAAGRLRNAFEYVLFFVKSSTFKHYPKRLAEPVDSSKWWIRFPERYSPEGITPSNVWTIPIPKQGAWGQESPRHACPFPSQLVDRLIQLATDPGDVVFDPFAGTGIVLARAVALGRVPLGLETNEALVPPFALSTAGAPEATPRASANPTAATVWKLRALKYARVVHERAGLAGSDRQVRCALLECSIRPRASQQVTGSLAFVVDSRATSMRRAALQEALITAACRKPASKFGVHLSIEVIDSQTPRLDDHRRLWRYPNGRFWAHDGTTTLHEQLSLEPNRRLTILSNLKVSEDREAAEVRD